MARRDERGLWVKRQVMEFLEYVMEHRPMFQFWVPLVFVAWGVERWLIPLSNWVPLFVCVWATIQYGKFERHLLVDDFNKRLKQAILQNSHATPLEQCEWLNKFLIEVWPKYFNPKFSNTFSSIVEGRLKQRKPKLIESVELVEFSLGSCPPTLGLHGTRWSASGDQRILHMGFEWDTDDINIMLFAKLAKPLRGTARIVVNSMHIKGNLLFMPILDGQALLYSFESTPEVRISVVFGSGGSQALPATELPGVSSWLVKLCTDTLVKTMVEPRRRCYPLPLMNLRKKAVGGMLSVNVVSANHLVDCSMKSSNYGWQQNKNGSSEEYANGGDVRQTFVEVELGQLTRKTNARPGACPKWDATFNMSLHQEFGIIKFNLYEWVPNNVKHDYITSCEIKVKYVADDSTLFWAVGPHSSVIAKRAESVGQEVEVVLPFEGSDLGELTVRLVMREWQFSDGSRSVNNSYHPGPLQRPIFGSSNLQRRTGRRLKITVMEGRDLAVKDKSGKCDPYVKLQYGKDLYRTRTISHVLDPVWNQKYEFDEIDGDEYLKIKCYSQETFLDEHIGSARVNLEGLVEGSLRDIWVPLEKVDSGELRLQIEAVKTDLEGSKVENGALGSGWIELILIEARDLVAADLRGTSDPYVRVQYGNIKKRTKVVYKTLHPQWNQTLDFPDDGSPLLLHVKDHNALLPTSSIGQCIVEYQGLPPNQMVEKWIPLQGVKKGEIHVKVTRRIPELPTKSSPNRLDSSESPVSKALQISTQMRQIMTKCHSIVDDRDPESLSLTLNEIESLQDAQEEYMLQLEMEQKLLIDKISQLGQEFYRFSPSRTSSSIN
ncbi:hypothetical protein Sjap_024474 [Stephania japonica]|uniref:Uncharacterized protein n=1 Tax=Stephania japonica TaxID=461633 RepID=A0AAP0EGP4_9MAGN